MDALDQVSKSNEAYILEAELTWTGNIFEKNISVYVGSDGKILDVKPTSNAATTFPKNIPRVSLAGFALLPGMVNAHSHAFQRGLRGKGETYPKESGKNSFWTWREEMYKLVETMDSEKMYQLTKQCFIEMRDAGITSVGEFHYFHHGENDARFDYDDRVLQAAKEVGIRIVLLNAFYEFGGFNRAPMSNPQKRFKISSHEEYWKQMDHLKGKLGANQSLGVVAHSMRAVDLRDLVKLHQESVKRGLVFHIHLEEQVWESKSKNLMR
jgi:formimidoylglutamate deiminase